MKEKIFFIQGMHCASCEILIEKKLLTQKGIDSVEASLSKNQVRIEYNKGKLTEKRLNKIFAKSGYIFSNHPFKQIKKDKTNIKSIFLIACFSLLLIISFILFSKSGLSSLVSVNSQSSLLLFFLFGILAGISSCAALVGGIVLSMSKQWLEIYPNKTIFQRFQPHLFFNFGRLLSYAAFGVILGLIGNAFQISAFLSSMLIFIISGLMVLLGLQMLGIKKLQKFQITMPKFITRYVANESNFKGYFLPPVLGALTFFLPCGFTLTVQALAIASGNPIQGGLILFFFALGTLPSLLFIGFSSSSIFTKPHLSNIFLKTAGFLVLFFALFNLNAQFNLLGLPSLSDLSGGKTLNQNKTNILAGGKQIIEMEASSYSYSPNYFKVKVNTPVRWEITDKGISGCTNAIISPGLFPGQISLNPGKTSIKEFTPTKTGKYKFSCWMGMVSGIIEVVDENSSSTTTEQQNPDLNTTGATCQISGGSDSCSGTCQGGCGSQSCPYNQN